jgi:tRNA pseudouridine32 synthase/23S rRNA pseudouridine746 synthase
MSEFPVDIEIVYQAPDFVVVNKPCGIAVQAEANEQGILPRLCRQLQVKKLWLVHRLDKVTSGLLILALSSEAAARLSGLFAHKSIQKFYLALSDKKPSKSQGTVIGDMQKVRDGKWMLQKSRNHPAVSQFVNCGLGDGLRLFLIKPHTGKTHQIRVLLKSLGSAILGDTHYGAQACDRVYLHAYALSFEDQGLTLQLRCLPQQGEHFHGPAFAQALENYSVPWKMAWPKLKYRFAVMTGEDSHESDATSIKG